MAAEKALVRPGPDGEVYLPHLHDAEASCAAKLLRLASSAGRTACHYDIAQVEKASGLSLAPAQRQAVATALTSGITVLTGGPGTGKTTTVKAIINGLALSQARVLLASPTGKAAKRLEETTGRTAMTIHRLLEFDAKSGHFERNAWNPLRGEALIIDEASMIDGQLMNSLLQAVPPTMRVVLVGDADQLPSVGAGNCLREIIASGVVPTVRLTTIFARRKAATSSPGPMR